jgi:predicted HicB family RNase H-like nuclease
MVASQQFNVYLPPDLVKELKHAAIEQNMMLSKLVEQALRHYLTTLTTQHALRDES